MELMELTKAEQEGFNRGKEYGEAKGRTQGYDEAFVVFLRMIEVERERTSNIDRRIALTHIVDNTIALKNVICL